MTSDSTPDDSDSDSDHAPGATRRTPEAETLSHVSGDTFQKNMIGVADGGPVRMVIMIYIF